ARCGNCTDGLVVLDRFCHAGGSGTQCGTGQDKQRRQAATKARTACDYPNRSRRLKITEWQEKPMPDLRHGCMTREPSEDTSPADALVLFGAMGDLAHKKIFPALYHMVQRGHLDLPVIGVAKAGRTDEHLKER